MIWNPEAVRRKVDYLKSTPDRVVQKRETVKEALDETPPQTLDRLIHDSSRTDGLFLAMGFFTLYAEAGLLNNSWRWLIKTISLKDIPNFLRAYPSILVHQQLSGQEVPVYALLQAVGATPKLINDPDVQREVYSLFSRIITQESAQGFIRAEVFAKPQQQTRLSETLLFIASLDDKSQRPVELSLEFKAIQEQGERLFELLAQVLRKLPDALVDKNHVAHSAALNIVLQLNELKIKLDKSEYVSAGIFTSLWTHFLMQEHEFNGFDLPRFLIGLTNLTKEESIDRKAAYQKLALIFAHAVPAHHGLAIVTSQDFRELAFANLKKSRRFEATIAKNVDRILKDPDIETEVIHLGSHDQNDPRPNELGSRYTAYKAVITANRTTSGENLSFALTFFMNKNSVGTLPIQTDSLHLSFTLSRTEAGIQVDIPVFDQDQLTNEDRNHAIAIADKLMASYLEQMAEIKRNSLQHLISSLSLEDGV